MSDVIPGYEEINRAWGQNPREMRKPTGPEAIKACRLLIQEGFRAFGPGPGKYRILRKRRFKLTSGIRRTYPRGGTWYVNPDERGLGLAEIVHSVSHHVHAVVHPRHKGHEFHAGIELHLVQYCRKMRWIEDGFKMRGKVEKIAPTRDEKLAAKIVSANTRLKTWQTKAKRATTAIRKLQNQIKRWEKANVA